MLMWLKRTAAVTLLSIIAACGGGGSDNPSTTESSLDQAANNEASASEFMKLAQAAGTTEKLNAEGQLTLIAPSNEAMAGMRTEVDELMLPENKAPGAVVWCVMQFTDDSGCNVNY